MKLIFEGLDNLIKEFESLASEQEVEKANASIVKSCAKVVERNLKPKVHRSRDPSKSGIKGMKTGKHAADNIETSKIKKTKGVKFITVGWEQGKADPYTYMQWEEWGNTSRAPHAMLYPTIQASYPEMNKVAKEEYEKLIKKLK